MSAYLLFTASLYYRQLHPISQCLQISSLLLVFTTYNYPQCVTFIMCTTQRHRFVSGRDADGGGGGGGGIGDGGGAGGGPTCHFVIYTISMDGWMCVCVCVPENLVLDSFFSYTRELR